MNYNVKPDLKLKGKQLISFIDAVIKQHLHPKVLYEPWGGPRIWKEVAKNLRKIIEDDKNILANNLVGLSKWLDYYSNEWMTEKERNKLNSLLTEIVMLSVSILSSLSNQRFIGICGSHEDKACVLQTLSPRITNPPCGLPFQDAINFWAPYIHKIDLCQFPNLNLIRVIGVKNNPYGSYWLVSNNLPNSKKQWRNRYSVLTLWNSDSYYVSLKPLNKLKKPIECWIGFAASQPVPHEKCILPGGWHQAWIPPTAIYTIKHLVSNIHHTPTNW